MCRACWARSPKNGSGEYISPGWQMGYNRHMDRVLVTLRLSPHEATTSKVRRKLGLSPTQIDKDFGVVLIRPQDSLYTVLIDREAAAQLDTFGVGAGGPYANPRIEAFGPL